MCLGRRLLRFSFCVFPFFFFFFSRVFSPHATTVHVRYMNSSRNFWPIFREPYIRALFTNPQISFFINFFIKNGLHGIIYTFKNYFATVISAISFQFQQNKFYPNRLIIISQFIWEKNTPRASYLYFQCIHTKTHKVSPI